MIKLILDSGSKLDVSEYKFVWEKDGAYHCMPDSIETMLKNLRTEKDKGFAIFNNDEENYGRPPENGKMLRVDINKIAGIEGG